MKSLETLDCCPPLLSETMSTESAQQLAELLKVLADPARLRILSIVAAHEDHEACVCNLIAPLGLSQPTVSYHLKVLQEAGLLEREQRGVWAYYRLVPGPLALVRKALSPPPDSSVESPERAARSSWGRASS